MALSGTFLRALLFGLGLFVYFREPRSPCFLPYHLEVFEAERRLSFPVSYTQSFQEIFVELNLIHQK